MRRITTEVEYDDIIIEVEGDYYPGQRSDNYDVPDDYPYFVAEYFRVGGVDIGALLSANQEGSIIDMVMDRL